MDGGAGMTSAAGSAAVLCIPGASVSCTGADACVGHQICRDDGRAFERCECAAAGGLTGGSGGTTGSVDGGGNSPVGDAGAAGDPGLGGHSGSGGTPGGTPGGTSGSAGMEGGVGGHTQTTPGGAGGDSDGSAGNDQGGAGGLEPECTEASHCPASTACRAYACIQQRCVAMEQAVGTELPPAEQIDGDCKVKECTGVGGIRTVADDSDSPDPDDNGCTLEACDAGQIVSIPLPGDPCGSNGEKYCDGAGACVTCNADAQCPVGDACQARVCSGGECGFNPNWTPDWNKCTTESCNPLTGQISHTALHDCWQAIGTEDAPTARYDHVAVWTGTKMIVMRGNVSPGDGTNTGGVYDPVTNTWEATWTLDAPTRGWGGDATWYGGKMVITGGWAFGPGANLLSGAWAYDHPSLSWSKMSGPAGEPMGVEGTATIVDGWLVQWGGWPTAARRFSTLATGITGSDMAAAPFVRARHSAVAIGNEMFVYGGAVSNVAMYAEGGHKYNVATDSWTLIASEKPPLYPWRADHVAVAFDKKMLVWGGVMATASAFGNEALTNTGSIYDSELNTWSRMTMTNAPQARNRAPFVWTGTRVIVWGGAIVSMDGQPSGTGGVYEPGTDTWVTITSANAPLARKSHTAVWTGEAMLIWGGDGKNTGWLRDGALYYP
jgi:hypothetical protein